MNKDKHPYNDFFQKKLDNHESSVPDDLFNRLMTDYSMRKKLNNHDAPVNKDIFNQLMRNREGSDEQPSDAPLRERLVAHNSVVSTPTFEGIIIERERRRRSLFMRFGAAVLLLFMTYLMFLNRDFIFNNDKIKTEKAIDLNENLVQDNNELNQSKEDNSLTLNNKQLKNTEGGNSEFKLKDKQEKIIENNALNTVSNSANIITEHNAPQHLIIPTTTTNAVNDSVLASRDKGVGGKELKTDNGLDLNSSLSTPDAPDLAFDNLSILKVKTIALPTKTLENPCAGPGDGCPTFGKKRQHGEGGRAVYIDIYGAPEYAFRRLYENLPENASYLHARDTVEKPWYAFSAGTRISLVFDNGWTLRTGFVYAQTNEKAVFDSLGIGKKMITETYVPRPGGGQDTIRKTEITSGIFRKTYYNRYRSIDIPLQLGFEFPLNDYWSFSVNAGANFNIASWLKADILNEKGMQQNVSTGFRKPNAVFNNTLGISIFGSVAAYRQLTGNLQLVIEPSFRHYLQPITRRDYALKQAYTSGGLILGLRYRL